MIATNSNAAHLIGEKLRAARKKQKISLRELARRVDISASMLSQIETGRAFPSVRSLYSIAAALSVPVDYFFPEQDRDGSGINPSESTVLDQLTASEMRGATIQKADTTGSSASPPSKQPASPVVHATSRPSIHLKGGITWARLTALAEPEAEFLEVQYLPGAASGVNMSHHEGREFGLVLEGELVVELGFESYTLRSGDSIIFDSMTPHRLSNQGSQKMRAIWVVFNKV